MQVNVQLFSNLREYAHTEKDNFVVELAPEATVEQLIEYLGIPSSVQRVVLINGRHAKDNSPLANGDNVVLFPPMTGG